MRISQKLKLNSLVVLALVVFNASVAVFLVQRMLGDARPAGKPASPEPENGGHRYARRGYCPRFQQPTRGHQRVRYP